MTAQTTDQALTEHLGPRLTGSALTTLADLLRVGRPVEVVDVGASPLVGEPPAYAGLLEAGLARVTGFEPDEESLAELRQADDEHSRHLPHAVGDGGRHTLHVCAAGGFSSLLAPDTRQLAVLTDFPRLAEVTDRVEVDTVRLDDTEVERADLLALDIQGGEPAVLDGTPRVLATVFAVQVEVGFHRLYENGPTLADVDTRLRAAGFVPHTFVTTRTWPLSPVAWDDPLQGHARHLVEADLLYVRDLAHLAELSDDMLRAGALVACGAYGAMGVGLVCVRELAHRGALPTDAEHRFHDLVTETLGLRGTSNDGAPSGDTDGGGR
ncbi:FkbM family methyltransferase [Mobilicoccus pelagius]|uniref:Putative methyltransferase n=1 Tax=Mobilicoccus pelagius NBRC 104925 TaxID=1089455 RepID=H5UNQ3_9MICO|nr:FkbM family methyltransferase [Mobilicoccus pelagius]GAB47361.1 putative methyltransferase [Mobilicoccus pelagius NBRC 104925]